MKEPNSFWGEPLEKKVAVYPVPHPCKEQAIEGLTEAYSWYFGDFARRYAASQARNKEKQWEEELVRLYQTSAWSVRTIASYLNEKYQQSFSPSAISRRARKKLGVRCRREARGFALAA